MTQTRIVVTEPNGVQRMMPLTPRGLAIGRGTDNDLIVNYPTASRYHAQITFDGAYYYVTDLNSGNGTYLGNARLTPNEPTVWMPGTPLYVSDVSIQLQQGSQPLPQQPPQQPQQPARRERESTETALDWSPTSQAQDKGPRRLWLVLVLLLALLCVCSALGTAGYFYFVDGWF